MSADLSQHDVEALVKEAREYALECGEDLRAIDNVPYTVALLTRLADALSAMGKERDEAVRQRDQAVRLSNLSKSLLDDANAEAESLRDALENLTECVPVVVPYTNNWRPMEEAPKTGASIIYRYMEGSNVRAGVMCWMQTFSATESAEDTPCWWDLGLDDEAHKPTGWIPLPGGPA